MRLVRSEMDIGLEKPIKLLHITDTHLCYADERDDESKRNLAAHRRRAFGDENDSIITELLSMIEYGNDNCDAIVHTGDLIDFISEENLEQARRAMDKARNLMFIAGNHEFSRYVGEAWEDTAYKMTTFQHVQRKFGLDMLFSARIVGGVNIVGVDNGYYQFEPWQLWRLKREVQKGLPIVLMMHDPLYEETLYQAAMSRSGATSAGIVGCDEEHLLPYEEYRAVQQRPTNDTLQFIDYVNFEPLIRCVLAGHLHYHHEGILPSGKPQLVTSGGYSGDAREIILH